MPGSVDAVRQMVSRGYKVLFCTSPVLTSTHCAGEKVEWIRENFGPAWVSRLVLTSDKTMVRGDVLIDDKPRITGGAQPAWRQLLFDAPYNAEVSTPRIRAWCEWEQAVSDCLRSEPTTPRTPQLPKVASLADMAQAVQQLPDFSHLLPQDYRKGYSSWRSGRPKGAKGEPGEAIELVDDFNAMQDSVMNNTADDFTEVNVYRRGYAQWRRAGRGAKGTLGGLVPGKDTLLPRVRSSSRVQQDILQSP